MSNGAVLRKSGVALKRTNTPKKRAPGQIAAPPTPWDLKRKLLANQPSSSQGTTDTYKSTVGKQRKHQIRDNVEDSDEDDFYHWRRKYKRPKRRRVTRGRTPGERQETPSGGQQTETITIRPSAYETATEYTIARVRKSTQTGGRTTRRRRIERTRSETNRRSHKLEAKAGKEATACFVFESRFGKFVRRDQLKTLRKERYGSY